LPPKGGVVQSAEQAPVHKTPVHHGEPGRSSLKYEHEAAFAKVVADVVLLGHARPERGRVTELDVTLRVGPLRNQVRVYGDPFWRRTLGGRPTISAPSSFEELPLVYERAYGGWDRSSPDTSLQASDPRNPVGTGFVAPSGDPGGGLPVEGDDL